MTLKMITCALAFSAALNASAQSHVMDIKTAKPGTSTMPPMVASMLNW